MWKNRPVIGCENECPPKQGSRADLTPVGSVRKPGLSRGVEVVARFFA
jgi:hypothetical protein